MPCAGKQTVAEYLRDVHGFSLVELTAGDDGGIDELLRKAADWTSRVVACPILSPAHVKRLRKRTMFYLVAVDAPVLRRHARFRAKRDPNMSLADFIARDDECAFAATVTSQPTDDGTVTLPHNAPFVRECIRIADLVLHNVADGIDAFKRTLRAANLTDEERLRPSWTRYFIQLAHLASMRSNCIKRRVGCVLIKNNRVVATGYNGTPRYDLFSSFILYAPQRNSPYLSVYLFARGLLRTRPLALLCFLQYLSSSCFSVQYKKTV